MQKFLCPDGSVGARPNEKVIENADCDKTECISMLVFVTNKVNDISLILSEMMDKGLSGATVLDCKGMLKSLNESSVEPPHIFGALRKFINPEQESGKMLFIILKDENLELAKNIIRSVSGNLKRPNAGILFTIPVFSVEGVLD